MENRFDQDAATWDAKVHRTRLAEDVASAIRSEVVLNPRMKLLDFGCGTGLVSLPMAAEVAHLTGVDSSRGMLDKFLEKAKGMGFDQVDALQLNLGEGDSLTGTYDLILSSMTFHHIEHFQPVLSKLFESLNPDGVFCLADLDSDDGLFHSDPTGVHHEGFSREQMVAQFQLAGFQNIRVKNAAIMRRPSADGIEREFTIFLITGRRPATSG